MNRDIDKTRRHRSLDRDDTDGRLTRSGSWFSLEDVPFPGGSRTRYCHDVVGSPESTVTRNCRNSVFSDTMGRRTPTQVTVLWLYGH